MAEQGRRRKSLTPLESELQPPADWTPPGPVAEQYRVKVRPEKRAPTTTRGMLVRGLWRLALFVSLIGAAIGVVGFLFVYFADADAAATFPLLFYIAGALVMGGGLWSTFGHEWAPEGGYEQFEKETWIAEAFAYFAAGSAVIAAGFLLELLI